MGLQGGSIVGLHGCSALGMARAPLPLASQISSFASARWSPNSVLGASAAVRGGGGLAAADSCSRGNLRAGRQARRRRSRSPHPSQEQEMTPGWSGSQRRRPAGRPGPGWPARRGRPAAPAGAGRSAEQRLVEEYNWVPWPAASAGVQAGRPGPGPRVDPRHRRAPAHLRHCGRGPLGGCRSVREGR